ncbi:MAG TPA: DUF1488 family protein [Rhizomicrobium sp.]|jgi:hypothetical protein
MVGIHQSLTLSFRGKPHMDGRTGDVMFIAYMGLRFIPCRVKRSALKRLTTNPVPTEQELLQAFDDYRKQIELLVEEQVASGEFSPVISEINNPP